MGRDRLCAKLHSIYRPVGCDHPADTFRFRAVRVLTNGAVRTRRTEPDPVRYRQLSEAADCRQRSCDFTLFGAVRYSSEVCFWGVPGAFIGVPL